MSRGAITSVSDRHKGLFDDADGLDMVIAYRGRVEWRSWTSLEADIRRILRAMAKPEPKQCIVRTSSLDPEQAMHVRHPYNPRSEIFMTRLSDPAGLSHLGVSLARIPPGKESFALHVHTLQEEWIYVLSGQGVVRLDEEEFPVGPGDFVGFPPRGPAHVVCNTSDADLVFLQGGDRRPGDRGHFPELGKVGYHHDDGHMALIDEDAVELRPFTDWLAED